MFLVLLVDQTKTTLTHLAAVLLELAMIYPEVPLALVRDVPSSLHAQAHVQLGYVCPLSTVTHAVVQCLCHRCA